MGEYDHKEDQPFYKVLLSNVLDLTIIKPLIESGCGYDLITGEDLTEMERNMKVVGALVDLVTLATGIYGFTTAAKSMGWKKAASYFSQLALVELASDVSATTVATIGSYCDWPMGVTLLLSLGTGVTVGQVGNHLIFKRNGIEIFRKEISESRELLEGKPVLNQTGYDDMLTLGNGSNVSSSLRNNIDDILIGQGLTLDEFNSLRLRDISTLTDAEKSTLKVIRESVPMPDANTLMQKVIPASDIEKYLDGTYTQVGGYITRAEDVTQLRAYDDLYESLRLDYPGSVYKPMSDDSLGVIRYTTDETSKISIPYGTEMGGTVTEAPPFTGNGFTKATNGEIIPEFKCEGYLDIADGAQLIEIGKDGTETLRAVYSEIMEKFIPVE